MSQPQWNEVDRYLQKMLIPAEAVLDAVLTGLAEANYGERVPCHCCSSSAF